KIKLFDILPEDQAQARRNRAKRVGRNLKVVEMSEVLESENHSEDWKQLAGVKVDQIDGEKFKSLRTLMKNTLDEANPFEDGDKIRLLDERQGIRLALAFKGISPLRRQDRMRAILRGLEKMSESECYYWNAKIRSPSNQNGAKALRTLLSGHIN
ncbi:MAG: hypothetical protein ABEJ36_00215, partial [Candidatus Nanosalina sp.]